MLAAEDSPMGTNRGRHAGSRSTRAYPGQRNVAIDRDKTRREENDRRPLAVPPT
jgi:hypothetical protein